MSESDDAVIARRHRLTDPTALRRYEYMISLCGARQLGSAYQHKSGTSTEAPAAK